MTNLAISVATVLKELRPLSWQMEAHLVKLYETSSIMSARSLSTSIFHHRKWFRNPMLIFCLGTKKKKTATKPEEPTDETKVVKEKEIEATRDVSSLFLNSRVKFENCIFSFK